MWTFDRLAGIGGHPTTILGHPRIIATPQGPAVEFDGVGDALLIAAHPLAGARTYTWEAIFRPDGVVAGQFGEEQRWFHLQEDATGNRMLFEIRVLDGRWCLDAFNRTGSAQMTLLDRRRLHPLGLWYHVAAVYDGSEFRSYVNGTLEGSAPIRFEPQGPGRASVGVRINRRDYFKGAVRAARFTRGALPPAAFLEAPR